MVHFALFHSVQLPNGTNTEWYTAGVKRVRGDSHERRRRLPVGGVESAWHGHDLKGALAQRLSSLSWPKPPEGLKERCLRDVLAGTADEERGGPCADESGALSAGGIARRSTR